MKSDQLKRKLKSGGPVLGSWITLGHAGIAEIMARAGFDWLVVDLEHSVIPIDVAEQLIRVIELSGAAPLVRLTSNNPDQIKRVMDAGAHGVVVPMVKSVEDAERAIAAVRYAPEGFRGVGLARAQGYGTEFQVYLQWQKSSSVVIVQIEHIEAVENLDAILAVDGVDGYIIGPYDLSCSMGIPGQFNHPDFLTVMGRIRAGGARSGLPGGLHIVEPEVEQLMQALRDGHRFIAFSVDIRMLDVCARMGIKCFKEFSK